MAIAAFMIDAPGSPARIARIITRLNIGGPSIQAARLTLLLESHGYHTRLIHGRLGPGEGDMSDLAAAHRDVRYVDALRRPVAPFDDVRALWRLYRDLRAFRPHLVHTHMAKAGLLGRLAAALYNATRGAAPRARVVHTYHGHVLDGYFSPVVSQTFITLERLLARTTDRLIAISPTIRRELQETYRIGAAGKYTVVPLGFDLSAFAAIDARARADARDALAITPEAAVVTTVGRLTAIKQPHIFLQTIAALAAAHPRVIALVAGDGELRQELEARAEALGIADRVRWLGWRRDLVTVYGASDVFVLTSRNEGTPVAIIEAMAAGVPVVSTDVGGVRDVIDAESVGLLAPAGDVSALAAHAGALLADAPRRAEIAARARARVLEKYSIERLVDEIDAVYRGLASLP